MSLQIPDDDPERTFTQEEQDTLTLRLRDLIVEIRERDWAEPFKVSLILNWHRRLFMFVRESHAGKLRSRDFGDEVLVFGPNRSVHRENVEEEMRKWINHSNLIGDSIRGESRLNIEEKLKGALWIHARLVQIHPFQDGNGRVIHRRGNLYTLAA